MRTRLQYLQYSVTMWSVPPLRTVQVLRFRTQLRISWQLPRDFYACVFAVLAQHYAKPVIQVHWQDAIAGKTYSICIASAHLQGCLQKQGRNGKKQDVAPLEVKEDDSKRNHVHHGSRFDVDIGPNINRNDRRSYLTVDS